VRSSRLAKLLVTHGTSGKSHERGQVSKIAPKAFEGGFRRASGFNELRETLQVRWSGEFKRYADEELRAVLTLLAGPGVVWELAFGSWVLLPPSPERNENQGQGGHGAKKAGQALHEAASAGQASRSASTPTRRP
jgi:hypothetical protein